MSSIGEAGSNIERDEADGGFATKAFLDEYEMPKSFSPLFSSPEPDQRRMLRFLKRGSLTARWNRPARDHASEAMFREEGRAAERAFSRAPLPCRSAERTRA